MKIRAMLLGVLILGCGAGMVGQSAPQTSEARARELQSRYMTGVSAELTVKVDTKSAVVGQSIALRTKVDVTLADGKMIPAGTKLVGRVMAVHAKTDDQGGAMMTVNFDQAVLKDGKMLAVRSLIRTMGANQGGGPVVDPMTQPADANGTFGGTGGGSGIGGVTHPRGGGAGGIGGGGMGSGSNGGMGPATRGGRQGPPIAQTGPMGGATAPEATTQVDRRTVDAGESVTNRMRQTGVAGVLLATSPSDDTSGTLMEYGRNIVLENGTQITLGLISR